MMNSEYGFNNELNVLEFKLINPVKNHEEWVEIAPPNNNLNYVDIYIDGIQLLPVIYQIEEKQCTWELGTGYGHNSARWMYITCKDKLFYLYCCGDCGEPGCCSPTCEIESDNDYVIWKKFGHTNQDFVYDIRFKFDRDQYEHEVAKLKEWAESKECLC